MTIRRITISVPEAIADKAQRAADAGEAESVVGLLCTARGTRAGLGGGTCGAGRIARIQEAHHFG